MDILVFLAVLPVIALLNYINKKDAYEKEPNQLLTILFILGIIAALATIFITSQLDKFVTFAYIYENSTQLEKFLNCFLAVALVEEGLKYIFVMLMTWKNNNFNHVFDSIVYATYVSLGFACFENILYVLQGGIIVALLRAFISVPSHAFFAIFMGYYLSEAKIASIQKEKQKSIKNILKSIIIPVFIHGTFDYCLTLESIESLIFFLIFVVMLYIIAFKKIKKLSSVKSLFVSDKN